MTSLYELIFWVSISIVVYTYIGYGVLLYFLVRLKRLFSGKKEPVIQQADLPVITLLVAAYNEEDIIEDKITNSLELDYPKERVEFLFITDGSDDNTPDIIRSNSAIRLMHRPERLGKLAAVERALDVITSEIVVFSDANTMLNKEALLNLVRHFSDENVGAVAGEKRIAVRQKDAAVASGEGIYWKYESQLKQWDSELNSVVGAAGELFAIRKQLYQDIPRDSIIEDFYLTLKIAQSGYRVVYEPGAYALETSSVSAAEELKRKIRIATGGIQSIVWLKSLLNPFRYGVLTFQYVSHRVLRWTVAPLALSIIFVLNIYLALAAGEIYMILMILQLGFYLCALLGYLLEKSKLKIKILVIPFHFFIMNYAVYRGVIRYFKASQSVVWERAKRA